MSITYWWLSGALLALDPSHLPLDSAQFKSALHADSTHRDSTLLKRVHLDEIFIGHDADKDAHLPLIGQKTHTLHAARLRAQMEGNLSQTLSQIPGVQAIGIGSGSGKPMIRGLGFNRVAVVVAGTKHEGQQWGNDHGLEVDQWGIGEVLIVKGPASLSLGSDAVGGALLIEPHRMPQDRKHWGELTLFGRSNNWQHGTTLRLGQKRGAWSYDLRGTALRYADAKIPAERVYIYDYAVTLPHGRLRNTAGNEQALHAQVLYSPSDRLQNRIYLVWNRQASGFFAHAHGLEPRQVPIDEHDQQIWDSRFPRQSVQHGMISNRTTWSRGIHQWQLDLAWQINDREETNTYVPHGFMPNTLPDHMPAHLERGFKKHTGSLRLMDQWKKGSHQWTIGLQAQTQHQQRQGWTFLVPGYTQQQVGLYAMHHVQLHSRWQLQAGLRLDYNYLRTQAYQDWFVSGEGDQAQPIARSSALSFRMPTWVGSVGTTYTDQGFELDIHLGKSFRLPLAHELASNGINYHYFQYHLGNPELSPETAYQGELGLKKEWASISIEARPYVQWFQNYIYLNPTPQFEYLAGAGHQLYQYEQSQVLRWGGEWQVSGQWGQAWQWEWSGAWVRAIQQTGTKKGYGLPFTPPLTSLAQVKYHIPAQAVQGASVGFNWRYVAAQHQLVPPEKFTPAYHIFGMQMQVPFKLGQRLLQANLHVNNLLNRRYLNHTSFYRLIDLPEAGLDAALSLQLHF
jgi:iron complex outermembrane receptor protein